MSTDGHDRYGSSGARGHAWSQSQTAELLGGVVVAHRAETLKPGASVSVVARRHDVNANMMFTWRRHHQEGSLVSGSRKPRKPKLLPVIVQPDEAERDARKSDLAPRDVLAASTGRIEIEFPGGVRLRTDGMVDADTLRAAIRFAVAAMMPAGARIWLVAGVTDMRKYASKSDMRSRKL